MFIDTREMHIDILDFRLNSDCTGRVWCYYFGEHNNYCRYPHNTIISKFYDISIKKNIVKTITCKYDTATTSRFISNF